MTHPFGMITFFSLTCVVSAFWAYPPSAHNCGEPKPCPVCVPHPRIHIDDTDGDFKPSADCPAGWQIYLAPAAVAEYNKVKTYAAALNLLADAPCMREDK